MPILQTTKTSRLIREIRSRLGLTQQDFVGKLGVKFVIANCWKNGEVNSSLMPQKLLEVLLVQIGESIKRLPSKARQEVDLLAKPFKIEG